MLQRAEAVAGEGSALSGAASAWAVAHPDTLVLLCMDTDSAEGDGPPDDGSPADSAAPVRLDTRTPVLPLSCTLGELASLMPPATARRLERSVQVFGPVGITLHRRPAAGAPAGLEGFVAAPAADFLVVVPRAKAPPGQGSGPAPVVAVFRSRPPGAALSAAEFRGARQKWCGHDEEGSGDERCEL